MTLIEVLVATVLLGVGVTGLLSGASIAMRNQHRGESRLQAQFVAQDKMSEIELIGPHIYMLSRPMQGESKVGENSYNWSTTIEQQPVGELFIVRVTVAGEGRDGASAELSTWLNDYEAKAVTSQNQRELTNPGAVNPAQDGGS